MTRSLIGLAVLCLVLPVAAAEGDGPEKRLAGLGSVAGLTAKVVRAGCGQRLYFGEYELTPVGDGFRFEGTAASPWIHASPGSLRARDPKGKDWSRVDAPAGLFFPELFGPAPLTGRFEVDEELAKKERKPGDYLTPRSEEDRKLVRYVRLVVGAKGRPVEVTVVFANGDREFRTYSSWSPGTGTTPVESTSSSKVPWPPEKEWGSAVEATLDGLSAKVGKFKSITGNYRREKRTQLLLRPAVAKGRFRFVPGRLLWIDEEPRPSQVLITRTKMEIYDPKNKRLERFTFGSSKLGEYVFIGFGDSASVAFRSFRPLAFSKTAEEVSLTCEPVAGPLRGRIRTLRLRIDRGTGLMREITYRDPSGDSVTTRISGVRTDGKIDAGDVVLKTAAGTRIIDNKGELPWR